MSLREWARRVTAGERPGRSSIPDPDPSNRAIADALLDALHEEASEIRRARQDQLRRGIVTPGLYEIAASDLATGKRILELDAGGQIAIVRGAVDRCFPTRSNLHFFLTALDFSDIGDVTNRILRRKLPYSPEDVEWLLARVALPECDWNALEFSRVGLLGLLRSIERWSRDADLSAGALSSLNRLRAGIAAGSVNSQGRKALALIDQLLGVQATVVIDEADDWGHYAGLALAELEAETREQWTAFLAHAAAIPGTRPSKTWLREARFRIELLGEERFVGLAGDFLGLLDRPTRGLEYRRDDSYAYPTAWIADRNADVLKGIVWAASTVDTGPLARVIGAAALACFKKIPNYGSRSTKAGNACIHALAAMSVDEAVIQLKQLETRLKLPSARGQVEQALVDAAQRRCITPDDLHNLATPDFGLVDGSVRFPFGDYAAELDVGGAERIELRWLRPDGRPQKSVPAAVKRDFPEDLKGLRRTRKALTGALATQRARIERLMLQDRSWSLPVWRERYCDHPLNSLLARRLIWTFEGDGTHRAGAWLEGRIIDVDDRPLDLPEQNVTVRLWHPIDAGSDTVLAWREWLERHQVTQPFAQAHREVYILTDAERETETYSNRFAAHIIRQHQFAALCRERGWRYNLQGAWDSHNVPSCDIGWCGLRAEFWVEGVEGGWDDALSHVGIYLYASTDQVRFLPVDSPYPVALPDVPARVFSEVMRDVDLFVGVSSVGADPNWFDAGPDGHRDYWWDFSFGDLSASAITRRDVLAPLLPKLAKLEDRWELGDRFLTIQGDLRRYRIHLGSGNILMEPNDQYLCIVPGRGAGGGRQGDGLFLPFEGDQMLWVIISKALMLADDTRISDPTIKRQISG